MVNRIRVGLCLGLDYVSCAAELTAVICAPRHLRNGCTLLHHNCLDDDGAEGARRAPIAIKTYLPPGFGWRSRPASVLRVSSLLQRWKTEMDLLKYPSRNGFWLLTLIHARVAPAFDGKPDSINAAAPMTDLSPGLFNAMG